MRARIRQLTRTRSGKPMVHESELVADVLTIGRGTDNDLQLVGLMVPLHHAAFSERADGVYVEPREPRPLAVNGTLVQSACPFRPGDVLTVGPHEIRRLASPDAHVLLEVERVQDERSDTDAVMARARIGVERGLFTRRKLSWAAVGAVMLFAAALPLAASRRKPGEASAARAAVVSWMPGPVSRVHSFAMTECASCHAVPFAPVRDRECQACHRTTGRHVAPGRPEPALFATTRCGSCHPEHRGERRLVGSADGMCTRCHADLKAQVADTTLGDAVRFNAGGGHPEFRIVAPVAPETLACERLAIARPPAGDAPASEREDVLVRRTGLRFGHALHLREGLRRKWTEAAGGPRTTLRCADCHVPDGSGALFRPVTFREHCQTCHDLRFADTAPDRQVTHPAAPTEVEAELFQFYAARALADERGAVGPEPVRRRPGAVLTEEERPGALAWARREAARAADDLLGKSGIDAKAGNRGACAACHGFEADGTKVVPVRVAGRCGADADVGSRRWMTRAGFDHATHRSSPCAECHKVEDAAASPTGMLPGRAACVGCHGPAGAGAGRTLDRCVQCHGMHVERYGPIGEARLVANDSGAAAEGVERAAEAGGVE